MMVRCSRHRPAVAAVAAVAPRPRRHDVTGVERMPETITSLIIGGVGGAVAAAIQYAFRRYTEDEQVRRDVVETHLLQLQDSVESLHYRVHNLRSLSGADFMPDDYLLRSSAYVFGRVLARGSLLVSRGIYARLHRNVALKRSVKSTLHSLDRAMDDEVFLHYDRLLLAEMLLDGDRVITYTEFAARWTSPERAAVVSAVSRFVQTVSPERLDRILADAERLVALLAAQTKVPSAMELAGAARTDR